MQRNLNCLLKSGIPFTLMYLNQNSQAVKKVCSPQKGQDEKRCEIQGGAKKWL